LPGVRELFQSKKKEEDEENQALSYYKKFINQGPAYYGDLDEADGKLIAYEHLLEDTGKLKALFCFRRATLWVASEWEDAYLGLLGALGLPTNVEIPKIPRVTPKAPQSDLSNHQTKRNPQESNGDVDMTLDTGDPQKQPGTADGTSKSLVTDTTLEATRSAAAFIPFLDPTALQPPKLPSREEMEGVLLELRKKALVDEYFGDEGS
jgi:pre-mRNA-splicing factor ISY1